MWGGPGRPEQQPPEAAAIKRERERERERERGGGGGGGRGGARGAACGRKDHLIPANCSHLGVALVLVLLGCKWSGRGHCCCSAGGCEQGPLKLPSISSRRGCSPARPGHQASALWLTSFHQRLLRLPQLHPLCRGITKRRRCGGLLRLGGAGCGSACRCRTTGNKGACHC